MTDSLREALAVHVTTCADTPTALRDVVGSDVDEMAYARVGRIPTWLDDDGKVEFLLSLSARAAGKFAERLARTSLLDRWAARDRRVTVLRALADNRNLGEQGATHVTFALIDAGVQPPVSLGRRMDDHELVAWVLSRPDQSVELLPLVDTDVLTGELERGDPSGHELAARLQQWHEQAPTRSRAAAHIQGAASCALSQASSGRAMHGLEDDALVRLAAIANRWDTHDEDEVSHRLAATAAARRLHTVADLPFEERAFAVAANASVLDDWVDGQTVNDPRPGEIEAACRQHPCRVATFLHRRLTAGIPPTVDVADVGAALQIGANVSDRRSTRMPVGRLHDYLRWRLGDRATAWQTLLELVDTVDGPLWAFELADQVEFLAGSDR